MSLTLNRNHKTRTELHEFTFFFFPDNTAKLLAAALQEENDDLAFAAARRPSANAALESLLATAAVGLRP